MPRAGGQIRGWLSPQVDEHQGSFLGRRIGRMAGPAWTMALWDVAMFVIMLVNVLALSVRDEATPGRLIVALYWGAVALALIVMGNRVRPWQVHLLLDLNVLVICWISLTAVTELRMVSNLMFLLVAALFAATWFPRRQLVGHLLVILFASALVLGVSGVDSEPVRVWVVLMVVCAGVALLVNSLVLQLNQQVTLDALTGLLNRAGLDLVAEGSRRASDAGLPRSVVVLDLDGFKAVNDERGHHAGDDVLRQVASVMRAQLRPDDVVTRTGGDEFVLILRHSDVHRAGDVVQRLAGALPIGSSFGIADWPASTPLDEAVRVADSRMYEQKTAKRA